MAKNIFEYATRNKIRLASTRGELTVEQLWDVPLRSRDDFNLNTIAKAADKALKLVTEDNFVETTVRTPEHGRAVLRLELIKHVIEVKLNEETAAETRATNRLEKEKLLKILAEKQDGKLSALSESDLKKRIAALEE